jgi:hypothetical protein
MVMSKQAQHPRHLSSSPSTEPLKKGATRQSALQPKAAGLRPTPAAQGTARRTPVASPVYRPQPASKLLQAKAAHVTQQRQPNAPPVYRPQPMPKVMQIKMASGQQSEAQQSPRRPVAPPVYRPEQKKIVQPKIVADARGLRFANQPVAMKGTLQTKPPITRKVSPDACETHKPVEVPARKSAIQLSQQANRRLQAIVGHLRTGGPSSTSSSTSVAPPKPVTSVPSSNWKVVKTAPNAFKIGVFVTAAANDINLEAGWKSREWLAKEGRAVVFKGSRVSEGQYFVLDTDSNAKKALDFYSQQIAKGSKEPIVKVSCYAVYWAKEEGPDTLDITPPKGQEWEYESSVFYQSPTHPVIEQATNKKDAILEHRTTYSAKGPEHAWQVLEGKINPGAIKHLVLFKESEELVKNPDVSASSSSSVNNASVNSIETPKPPQQSATTTTGSSNITSVNNGK